MPLTGSNVVNRDGENEALFVVSDSVVKMLLSVAVKQNGVVLD